MQRVRERDRRLQDTVPFMQSVDGLHVTWHFTHGHITQTHKYTYTATTDDSVVLLVLKHNPLLTVCATS